MTAVLCFIENENGAPTSASLEMLTLAHYLAKSIDGTVEAVIFDSDGDGLAESFGSFGVAKTHCANHELLTDYAPAAWAKSISQLMQQTTPHVVMAPGTERGNEVFAHLAAQTDLPLASNCTEVNAGETYRVTRTRWGGSLLEEASLSGEPKLLTTAPHAFTAIEESASPNTEIAADDFTPELSDADVIVRVVDRVKLVEEGVSLADAPVVIGGGRGVGSEEGFAVLESLGQILGAPVGGSRVATNNGWRSHADQIGLTGTKIAPDLYIACGISGAVQHMVGCKGAKRILVINMDREAPILSKADYAVFGDLHEIIPAIIDEIKKTKGN